MGFKQGQKNTGTPGYPVEGIVMAAATAVSTADDYDTSGSYRTEAGGAQQAQAWCV